MQLIDGFDHRHGPYEAPKVPAKGTLPPIVIPAAIPIILASAMPT